MLALAWVESPCELRADFQQYYGLNLDDMGGGYTISHAACLCAQLPRESRTLKALATPEQSEELLWTLPVRIAVEQLNMLNVIRWLHTKDAAEGVNFPKPLLPPELRDAELRQPDAEGYKAALAELRERINQSNGGD